MALITVYNCIINIMLKFLCNIINKIMSSVAVVYLVDMLCFASSSLCECAYKKVDFRL